MFFEIFDGDLSGVEAMAVRRDGLELHLLQSHVGLEGGRRFVIEELEDGLQSAFCEDLTKFDVGEDKLGFGS